MNENGKRQASKRQPAKRANAEKRNRPLKPKEEAFAENYVANGGNATDAARKAGVKGSEEYVSLAAHRMIRNDKIQSHIHKRTRERLKGVKANADEIYYLLSDHLRVDIADFEDCFTEEGSIDLQRAKAAGVSHLVKKVRTRIGRGGTKTIEIEFHDSQAAAARLAKLMGLEQQPRTNQDDVARLNAELAKLVAEGWEPEKAREIILEAEPTASRLLQ